MKNRGEADGSIRKLTAEDALEFLKNVKDVIGNETEKYEEFLQLMKDLAFQRIDIVGVITGVKRLFRGHNDLILGFNTFLPQRYAIACPLEDETPPRRRRPLKLGDALDYVSEVKRRFEGEFHIFNSFMRNLHLYKRGKKPLSELHREVCVLMQDHPDLVEGFADFLPCPSLTTTSNNDPEQNIGVDRPDEEGMSLIEKMNQKLREVDVPQQFVKCLDVFDREIITPSELHSMVALLLITRVADVDTEHSEDFYKRSTFRNGCRITNITLKK
ncbi:paired amphipathic helix protein Sin3-like 3 [Cucurbita pepo subsp. pepo]|uniref:paired amphipathic helix protein Sin3-like 3 n=1 Tax=Cucurbita pepo subsp. pepo TaxID=3664 RepID=UPI000C9D3806|nr:paired amphipathic helix protein Sin3-like 3 [Cucurbita pepo subsp. pepo]